MHRDINSRADELAFGYGAGAVDEAIFRVQDSLEVRSQAEGERWLSAAFELKRRALETGSKPADQA